MSKEAPCRTRNDITTTKAVQIYEMPDFKRMREGKGGELMDIIVNNEAWKTAASSTERRS